MKTSLYIIEPISNLHVGSGKENFGVVDNLIQRDVTTNLPSINASSLKGAMREHLKRKLPNESIVQLFGSDPVGANAKSGSCRFFDAHLLAIPVRGERSPYYLATCPQVITDWQYQLEMLCVPNAGDLIADLKKLLDVGQDVALKIKTPDRDVDIRIEDLPRRVSLRADNMIYAGSKRLKKLFREQDVLILSNKCFRELCDDFHLPIIARNHLVNGESKNLFYEQVLPRYSLLYFVTMESVDGLDLSLNEELVQIGANASVGNGFCKLRKW